MTATPVYRSTPLYEAIMLGLYGRHYFARYRAIAELIPDGASVLDVCCGPAILYSRYLKHKGVSYTGLDLSKPFIERLNNLGGRGIVWNLRSDTPLPRADYVVMQASLYHFLPDVKPVIDRMLNAANRQVVIAEPVRNVTTSRSAILSAMARRFTNPGDGHSYQRFTELTLDALFSQYAGIVDRSFHIPGDREKVYALNAGAHRSMEPAGGALCR